MFHHRSQPYRCGLWSQNRSLKQNVFNITIWTAEILGFFGINLPSMVNTCSWFLINSVDFRNERFGIRNQESIKIYWIGYEVSKTNSLCTGNLPEKGIYLHKIVNCRIQEYISSNQINLFWKEGLQSTWAEA